ERGGRGGRGTVADPHCGQHPAETRRPPSFELPRQDREELVDAEEPHHLAVIHHRYGLDLPATQDPHGLLHGGVGRQGDDLAPHHICHAKPAGGRHPLVTRQRRDRGRLDPEQIAPVHHPHQPSALDDRKPHRPGVRHQRPGLLHLGARLHRGNRALHRDLDLHVSHHTTLLPWRPTASTGTVAPRRILCSMRPARHLRQPRSSRTARTIRLALSSAAARRTVAPGSPKSTSVVTRKPSSLSRAATWRRLASVWARTVSSAWCAYATRCSPAITPSSGGRTLRRWRSAGGPPSTRRSQRSRRWSPSRSSTTRTRRFMAAAQGRPAGAEPVPSSTLVWGCCGPVTEA